MLMPRCKKMVTQKQKEIGKIPLAASNRILKTNQIDQNNTKITLPVLGSQMSIADALLKLEMSRERPNKLLRFNALKYVSITNHVSPMICD